MNIIPKILSIISPQSAVRWLAAEAALRHYNAASISGPNQKWNPKRGSVDSILKSKHKVIVERARDLVRNNIHVSAALNTIVDQVIHTGIKPQVIRRKTSTGELYDSVNDQIESEWGAWAKAEKFYYKQQLILRHLIVDGECFIHWWIDSKRVKAGICPLRLRVLEPEMIDEQMDNSDNIRRGIEFDNNGDPAFYYVFKSHPESSSYAVESSKIPASDIIHIFEQERASQTRGVSKLASVIESAHSLDEYQYNEGVAARLAAAFGIFIKSPFPEMMGGMTLPGQNLNADGSSSGVPDYIEPGRIQPLPPGMEIQVADSSRPGQTYEPYVKTSLKALSAGLGLKYGTFSHDYTDSSYSSERSAALDERRRFERYQMFIVDMFCDPVFRLFENTALTAGLIKKDDNPTTWQTPGWPWVDPYKDAQAANLELEMGVTTRRDICAARGKDFDEVIKQLEREDKILKAAGLKQEEIIDENDNDNTDTDSETE